VGGEPLKTSTSNNPVTSTEPPKRPKKKQYWEKDLDVSSFVGRASDKDTLKQQIVRDRCRLVLVWGMGGVGKTFLAKKIAEENKNSFDYIIWLSLRESPPLEQILVKLFEFLSDREKINLQKQGTVSSKIALLIEHLSSSRCLLILDNLESIMKSGIASGKYREGYENYRELINAIGEEKHKSCLLLTSREKPQHIRESQYVVFHEINGFSFEEDGQIFLQTIGLYGVEQELRELFNWYSGNPLFIELAAKNIKEVFSGSIFEFLTAAKRIVGESLSDCENERDTIRKMLEWYFQKLSNEQKEIMYWLAINREAISIRELQNDILSQSSKTEISNTLESLRTLIPLEKRDENNENKYTLQNVLTEYTTDKLIEEICREINTTEILFLGNHALIKAQAADYVRETQIRLILKPIVGKLREGSIKIKEQLDKILRKLPRGSDNIQYSYAAGNILNLFCYLKTDISGYDFSGLAVWQAYLQNINLYNVDFTNSNLKNSVFIRLFSSIFSLSFSPNGEFLAGGGGGGNILIWSLKDGQQVANLEGHSDRIWSVDFSPDGKILASGSDDETIKLWNFFKDKPIDTRLFNILKDRNGKIWKITFNNNGDTLASAGDYGIIKLWNLDTNEVKAFELYKSSIRSIAFNHKSTIIASANRGINEENKIIILDIQNNKYYTWLIDEFTPLAFKPNDENLLAFGQKNYKVEIRNIKNWDLIRDFAGHNSRVSCITFSRDGQTLISGSVDGEIRVWDVAEGECKKYWQGHSVKIWSISLNRDEKTLASCGEDRSVRIWDISTGNCINILQGYANKIWSIAFGFSEKYGSIIVSGSDDKIVRIWNTNKSEVYQSFTGNTDRIWSVAYSPRCQVSAGEFKYFIASGGDDSKVRIWDTETSNLSEFSGHTERVNSVAFSSDGKTLVSASLDGTIGTWSVGTGQWKPVNILKKAHQGWIVTISFSPDGKIFASGGEDKIIHLWKVSNDESIKLKSLKGHFGSIDSIAFYPTLPNTINKLSYVIATGSEDNTVRLWNCNNCECKILEGHRNRVRSVAFSLNGQLLATGSEDCTIRLWNVSNINTPQPIGVLEGHESRIWSVAFSLDGNILASCGEDETIRLWDINKLDTPPKILKIKRPYENMKITNTKGIGNAQIAMLKALGAS
jgi:WD40 repeat protein